MAQQTWTMRGEYMESCNCDYLCPCIYTNPQGPATHDHCIAAMVFRIDEGNSGDTRLGPTLGDQNAQEYDPAAFPPRTQTPGAAHAV